METMGVVDLSQTDWMEEEGGEAWMVESDVNAVLMVESDV